MQPLERRELCLLQHHLLSSRNRKTITRDTKAYAQLRKPFSLCGEGDDIPIYSHPFRTPRRHHSLILASPIPKRTGTETKPPAV